MDNFKHNINDKIKHIVYDVDKPSVLNYIPLMEPTEKLYAQLGKIIRHRREKLDLTQMQLAQALRISRASLANMEVGRQNVMLHQIYNLAQALQMDARDLLPKQAKPKVKTLPMSKGVTTEQRKQISELLTISPTVPGESYEKSNTRRYTK